LNLIAESVELKNVLSISEKAAKTEYPILIEGESGVGKEMIARYIHKTSNRSENIFIPINCGAIPDSLFEAEFMGFERGSFTNAFQVHKGFFEQADGGTLFLDEISEIPLFQQVKLLRVLEEHSVKRVGGEKDIPISIRVISATNRPLKRLIQEGKFRLDLYYRISTININVPPLRERKDDIRSLTEFFLSRFDKTQFKIDENVFDFLQDYHWPGNVRELESCIARSVTFLSKHSELTKEDIVLEIAKEDSPTHRKIEQVKIESGLLKSNGNVKSAARLLGIHRNTLYNKILKYHIDLDKIRSRKLK